jgi:hypothetical protein
VRNELFKHIAEAACHAYKGINTADRVTETDGLSRGADKKKRRKCTTPPSAELGSTK